jgi:hypothetical protein
MTTEVKICSNALLRLGKAPISSLEDGSVGAQAAANLYPQVRDSLLRSHPWNCAMKRVVLSPVTDSPAFGYNYAFNLPGDFLRAWHVSDEPNYDNPAVYAIEGRQILCDESVIYLQYGFRNEDPATWDALLVSAMEVSMAAVMAIIITGDAAKKQEYEREAMQILRQARAVDGMENPPQEFHSSSLYRARRR